QQIRTGEFYLIDLGSRNGSFLNDRQVTIPVKIQSGDRVALGQSELEFFNPQENPELEELLEPDARDTSATYERRLISVLVVDIRDFTVLTRKIDEKLLSEVMGLWFRRAGEIIREHGSWVDKYIGDAVMAVWIHSSQWLSYEEISRILAAAKDFHKMTSVLHQEYPLPFPLRVGAGINTGYAMVGNSGSGDRPDYTALGDTVNAAFRLESATKQLGLDLALGESTYQYLSELGFKHAMFQQHTVHLKGYEQSTLTYACSFPELD
ncbi:MAG: adenylate/guanylate cyclase domain-containing protein, partial [Leptolyngbyaceae bacterium]|nr:adenylate/guanylate cyclase domain-containing protein [Leptolyngbyaceae bacterium]